ncbi:hypothetical protein M0812_25387 [Anaeramoeba flamelloides]|uniref:Uncharacterized protein n=1 Tax=Anaeramoeba flamelloides TaxID=1746091 RepID=A0AAV7YJL1_9EUKA|nr:hypothetical protein M0812_25387 [Anaeramoeba flamelloides]
MSKSKQKYEEILQESPEISETYLPLMCGCKLLNKFLDEKLRISENKFKYNLTKTTRSVRKRKNSKSRRGNKQKPKIKVKLNKGMKKEKKFKAEKEMIDKFFQKQDLMFLFDKTENEEHETGSYQIKNRNKNRAGKGTDRAKGNEGDYNYNLYGDEKIAEFESNYLEIEANIDESKYLKTDFISLWEKHKKRSLSFEFEIFFLVNYVEGWKKNNFLELQNDLILRKIANNYNKIVLRSYVEANLNIIFSIAKFEFLIGYQKEKKESFQQGIIMLEKKNMFKVLIRKNQSDDLLNVSNYKRNLSLSPLETNGSSFPTSSLTKSRVSVSNSLTDDIKTLSKSKRNSNSSSDSSNNNNNNNNSKHHNDGNISDGSIMTSRHLKKSHILNSSYNSENETHYTKKKEDLKNLRLKKYNNINNPNYDLGDQKEHDKFKMKTNRRINPQNKSEEIFLRNPLYDSTLEEIMNLKITSKIIVTISKTDPTLIILEFIKENKILKINCLSPHQKRVFLLTLLLFYRNKNTKNTIGYNPESNSDSLENIDFSILPKPIEPTQEFNILLLKTSNVPEDKTERDKTLRRMYFGPGINFLLYIIVKKKFPLQPGFMKIRKQMLIIGHQSKILFRIPLNDKIQIKKDQKNVRILKINLDSESEKKYCNLLTLSEKQRALIIDVLALFLKMKIVKKPRRKLSGNFFRSRKKY